MAAGEYGHLGLVRRLIALGANVFAHDKNNWTALNYSAVQARNRRVRKLIQEYMNTQRIRK